MCRPEQASRRPSLNEDPFDTGENPSRRSPAISNADKMQMFCRLGRQKSTTSSPGAETHLLRSGGQGGWGDIFCGGNVPDEFSLRARHIGRGG